jgi:4-hydroxysphinganine ceramide fatty acyl 2-hydroxylase
VFATFFRHGGAAALAIGALAPVALIAFDFAPFRPLDVVIGALLFYGSEYLMHRFAFHAPPAGIPFVRRLQHRLH